MESFPLLEQREDLKCYGMFSGVYTVQPKYVTLFYFVGYLREGPEGIVTLTFYVGIRYMLDRGLLGGKRWFSKTVDKYQQMMTSKHLQYISNT